MEYFDFFFLYSMEFGIEMDGDGNFAPFNSGETQISPKFDFYYSFGANNEGGGCLFLDITASLKLIGRMGLYKLIWVGLEFEFTLPMILEYPSNCEGEENYCKTNKDARMGMNFGNGFGGALYITPQLGYDEDEEDTDEEVQQILDLLGISGEAISTKIKIFDFTISLLFLYKNMKCYITQK